MTRVAWSIRQWALVLAILPLGSPCAAADARPEQLFPPNTREFLASPNLKEARQAFEKTQFGRLLDDPLLEKFFDDLDRQAELRNPTEFLGFKLNELSQVAGGEGAWGTVELGPRRAG